MVQTIINFLNENPYLSYGLMAVVLIFTFVFLIRRASYEHIRCKVIESGRYRYTDVYRNKRTNVYKVHNRSGEWVVLSIDQVNKIEEVRRRFAKRIKYNKHVTPEFNLSD